jgi:hypothetical protein
MEHADGWLDPYGLLGVTIDTPASDVKKAYYALSLLAHPDKGGRPEDMMTVHNAYKYVMAQVLCVNRTGTVEDLEAQFASFCRQQSEEPPRFRNIAKDAGENERFHGSFLGSYLFDEGETSTAGRLLGANEYVEEPSGYGNMMESSEYESADLPEEVPEYRAMPAEYERPHGDNDSGHDCTPFRLSITPYIEPEAIYGLHRCHGTDYQLAFNTTPEELPSDMPEFNRTLSSLLRERAAFSCHLETTCAQQT